jgi:hypothetical protein
MSSNISSFKSNQTNKSEWDNDPRFTGKAHANHAFLFVNDDFPPLPVKPFYCPYVGDDGQPEFATRKEYIDFCKKHGIVVLDDKQLKAIGDQYEQQKQELLPTFYCPYDNLEGKCDETGKLLPRFQTRSQYEAWCKECSRDPLNDQQLIALGKRWADEAELTRLQVGCRDYLDYLEAQWWETC